MSSWLNWLADVDLANWLYELIFQHLTMPDRLRAHTCCSPTPTLMVSVVNSLGTLYSELKCFESPHFSFRELVTMHTFS